MLGEPSSSKRSVKTGHIIAKLRGLPHQVRQATCKVDSMLPRAAPPDLEHRFRVEEHAFKHLEYGLLISLTRFTERFFNTHTHT